MPLSSVQLAGFRLHPGPLPEHYRYLNTAPTRKHKNKHKKHKHKDGSMPQEASLTGNLFSLMNFLFFNNLFFLTQRSESRHSREEAQEAEASRRRQGTQEAQEGEEAQEAASQSRTSRQLHVAAVSNVLNARVFIHLRAAVFHSSKSSLFCALCNSICSNLA